MCYNKNIKIFKRDVSELVLHILRSEGFIHVYIVIFSQLHVLLWQFTSNLKENND